MIDSIERARDYLWNLKVKSIYECWKLFVKLDCYDSLPMAPLPLRALRIFLPPQPVAR